MDQAEANASISLTIEHLQKSFHQGRKKVLTDINLTANGGECIGILGANGCGKSTLLSILAGILVPDSGCCQINGNIIIPPAAKKGFHLWQSKRTSADIGYVPQECPLIEELNAMDNLKLWYCDSPLSLSEELENGLLAMLGIPDFLKTKVKNMSGGMKKRLSIGCALSKKPRILLLDEPGAALDLICKERIEVYLRHYKTMGNLALLATHEEREINLCDRLYILKEGVLVPLEYDGNIHKLASKL